MKEINDNQTQYEKRLVISHNSKYWNYKNAMH
jgi:hypothetical protein